MALTSLDVGTALVVIDLQAGIVSLPGMPATAEVVQHASALAAAFRSHGLPVVLVNVDGGAPGRTARAPRVSAFPHGWTELLAALNPQASDHTVTKRTWGAFTGTDLEAYLKQRGVTQVVLAGIATSAGVESTARHAHELGFNVALAVDAMTDPNAEAHTNSVTHIFPRLGEPATSQEILTALERARV